MVDRPMLGILLMAGFCFLAPLGDSLAKLAGERAGLMLIVVVRFAAQALLLAPLVLWRGGVLMPRGRLLGLTLLRTALHVAGLFFMFSALQFLPVADAIAIAFVLPFLMLLLGWLFLGEEVGPHRLAACAVGFVGVLLVIRPNFAEVGPPALLPLGVAVVFSVFMLITRGLTRRIDSVALQAVSGIQATAVMLPLLLILPAEMTGGFAWQGGGMVPLVVALGVTGTVAHLLMTWSLRFAPAATLAPMQYLEIPFATLIGWLLFRDLPDGLAAVGICVTVAAGLYIIARERAIALRPPPVP